MKTKTMRIDVVAQVLVLDDEGNVANELPVEGKFFESQFSLTLGQVAEQVMLQVNDQLTSQGFHVDPVRPVRPQEPAPEPAAVVPVEEVTSNAPEPERTADSRSRHRADARRLPRR